MEQKSTSLRLSSNRPVVRDISESLGKLPPSAIDVEEAVLGALMLEKHALIEIAGVLKVEHFYSEQHQAIYQAILDLFSEGSPVDMRSVVSKLRTLGKLEMIGGAYYIAELTSKVSSAANIEYHSRIIIELAIKRNLIHIASWLHHDAYEDTVDVFDLYAKLNLELQDVLDKAVSNRAEKSAKELSLTFIKDLQAKIAGKHGGIKTGFPLYDQLMDGLHNTDLTIFAARPGVGKSNFSLQIGKQVAEQGFPVGVFSLEMSGIQLVGRMNVAESGVVADKIKKGKLDNFEFSLVFDAVGRISGLPMYIDDTPALSIVEIRARAIRMKLKYGIRLLIIDYIQLIKSASREGTRDQELGTITRTLKAIAKELDIPVIALSQLSRAVETRGGDKRPQLSDLRESGSIEQDCDICCFLYRPEIYNIRTTDDGQDTHGLCEIIVAKHRNGGLDTIRQKFIGSQQRFAEWISESPQSPTNEQHFRYHTKSPLPSERTPEQLESTDTPF